MDRQPVALQRARDLFQSVDLAPRFHDIRFVYQPPHGRWILAGFGADLMVLRVSLAGELVEVLRGRRVARM
ncbi:hypothetical protein DVT68_09455 [Dyella solisilvae]|uniref:NTF2 fold domain-containing protein n=1 Tax=Dyella solisilvae TaxID=1920168 RepID=A0A370K7X0_9GAMM|nr:hypothetical protein DVT68_09455 [Dyella solisilvae]